MNASFPLIAETTCGRLFAVRDTGSPDLSHVQHGIEVKRTKGGFAPKSKTRQILVRKAGSRLI
jgi:hypothetical protein